MTLNFFRVKNRPYFSKQESKALTGCRLSDLQIQTKLDRYVSLFFADYKSYCTEYYRKVSKGPKTITGFYSMYQIRKLSQPPNLFPLGLVFISPTHCSTKGKKINTCQSLGSHGNRTFLIMEGQQNCHHGKAAGASN